MSQTAHMDDAHGHHAGPMPEVEHTIHPLGVYFTVWGLLFVLSAMSYGVDYFGVHGIGRWVLIITFMLLKAGFIVAIFMHMAWERLALKLAILTPPLALLVLIGLMAIEGDYTFVTRLASFVR